MCDEEMTGTGPVYGPTARAHDRKIKRLSNALASCVKAMKDVQDHWADSGSWSHNRLETPMLVHADAIKAALKE